MKLAKEGKKSLEPGANYVHPLYGCVCSSGQASAKSTACACQCNGGTTNYNSNYNTAYKA